MANQGLPNPSEVSADVSGTTENAGVEASITTPALEVTGGETAPDQNAAGASNQTGAVDPTPIQAQGNLLQSVPYSRFAEVNRSLQALRQREKEWDEKGKRFGQLEEQDRFLAQYFEQHPEEYSRMQSIHQGKVDELQDAKAEAQDQLNQTGEITPALARQMQTLRNQIQQLGGSLKEYTTQQAEERATQQHYDQFRLELNEFEADKKYGDFKGDKELLSVAVGLAKANGKSLLENLRKLADRELSVKDKVLKGLVSNDTRRQGAKVETGGGKTGTPPKPIPRFGTEDHLKAIADSYGS